MKIKTDKDRWGIIYVPRAGVTNAQKRWIQIREYLELRGVSYDYVQSEGVGSIERLTHMLIENGYRTIVLVGGDEAMNDVVNGIMFTDPEIREKVVLGLVPNGIGNDFADFWGLESDKYKQAIHAIIARNIKKIDVGYCSYSEQGIAKTRYFLMAMNLGLAARAIHLSDRCRRFGKYNPAYLFAMFSLFKERKQYKMRLRVNNEEISEKIMTVCVGNSRGYGLTPSAVPYNGWLDVSVVFRPQLMQMVKGLRMLLHSQILNHEQVKPYRTKEVEIIDAAAGAEMCLDGRFVTPSYPLSVSLEPAAINFIIPS